MYSIFTYIWIIYGVDIPYMEHMALRRKGVSDSDLPWCQCFDASVRQQTRSFAQRKMGSVQHVEFISKCMNRPAQLVAQLTWTFDQHGWPTSRILLDVWLCQKKGWGSNWNQGMVSSQKKGWWNVFQPFKMRMRNLHKSHTWGVDSNILVGIVKNIV